MSATWPISFPTQRRAGRLALTLSAVLSPLIIPALTARADITPGTFTSMLVFGDSLSDTGNFQSHSAANSAAYAVAFAGYDPKRFTSGPQSVPAGNASGVWHEELAVKLGIPAATPSNAGGSNYAWGGALTTNGSHNASGGVLGITIPVNVTVLDLGGQVTQFNNAPISSSTLGTVWAGANDLTEGASGGKSLAQLQGIGTTAANKVQANIQLLINAGAKNILWLNMPSLEKTPFGADLTVTQRNALAAGADSFNAAWLLGVNQLRSNNPGVSIFAIDVDAFFNEVIAHPSTYSLNNVTEPTPLFETLIPPVAGNPDKYLFWDDMHPTARAHDLLANYVYQGIAATPIPEPASLALLACGLVALSRRKPARR